MKRVRRPLVLLLVVAALGSGGFTQVAQARIAKNVECRDHTKFLDPPHWGRRHWAITFKLRSLRPHTTTVVGRWKVKTDTGTRHIRYHAELAPREGEVFRLAIPAERTSQPTVDIVGCR